MKSQMTRASLAAASGNRTSGSVFLAAPVLGLNTVDPPGIMQPQYAMSIKNWLPLQHGLVTRGGSAPWAVGFAKPVETLMAYQGKKRELFAVSGTAIYRISPEGDTKAAPASVRDGLKSPRLEAVNFGNDAGAWLWCCNGKDKPLAYDGESWTEAEITVAASGSASSGDSSNASGATAGTASSTTGTTGETSGETTTTPEAPAETVPTPASVTVFQSRLFFAGEDGLDLWYLAFDAIQGEASKLPLGAYCERGGSIIALGSMTIDGGLGPDDYLVVITTEGEVLTFRGRNPDVAESWQMVGKFQIPRPLGRRAFCKWGGDFVIATEYGVSGVSQMLNNELAGLTNAATSKIQPTWAEHAAANFGKFGWDMAMYHRRGLMLVNMPASLGFKQMFFNPQTVAWCEIEGWNDIRCVIEYGGRMLAGTGHSVQLLDTGVADITPAPNDAAEEVRKTVVASFEQAFVAPGGAKKKRFTLCRPYIASQAQPSVSLGLSVDNRRTPYNMTEIMYAGDLDSLWYELQWNEGEWAVIVGDAQMYMRWAQAVGTGYNAGLNLEVRTKLAGATYTGADLQYVTGDAL